VTQVAGDLDRQGAVDLAVHAASVRCVTALPSV
jgi:hypothetical protein